MGKSIVQHRQLGIDGPEISCIGLGAWPISGGMGQVSENTAIEIIHTAIEHGITLIDTAQAYRASEEIIGKALKDGYRDRCFLATKVSRDYSRNGIKAALENSLRMLDVDYVDLYQIHGWNPKYPIEESMETMQLLQEQGKTRFIGVSNFNTNQMNKVLRTAKFESNQLRYNMFDREIESEDISFCEQLNIGILAHSSLAKGLLTGRYSPDFKFSADDERSNFHRFQGELFTRYLAVTEDLKQIAHQKGINLVQLAIAWILRLPAISCALVGAKNPDQVREHVIAADITFSDDELEYISNILKATPEA